MKNYIVGIVVFFSCVHNAYAGFEITEIMYDTEGTDADREWVEVRNSGQSLDDLSKWYLFSGNTKHALTPQGASYVAAGAYAVICQNVAKFKIDFPNFAGLLFDASWTGFNNEESTIALKDPNLNIVSSTAYNSSMGGAGTGDSLQNINGSWKGAHPNPGQGSDQANGESSVSSESSSTTTSTTVAISKSSSKKEPEIPKITIDILSKNIAFAQLPLFLNSVTFGYSKEPLVKGRYVWNFGDGSSTTLKEQNQLEHSYKYPGEYLVMLSYYTDFYKKIPDATDRITVKVLDPGITIHSVGGESDPYVELQNSSSYEMPLSQWILKSSQNSFTIVDDTIILPGAKIKFGPDITHFTVEDIASLSLQNPKGEVLALYVSSIKPEAKAIKSGSSSRSSSVPAFAKKSKKDGSFSDVIDLNSLSANAGGSTNKAFSVLPIMGLICIVAIAGSAVWILRRKKPVDQTDEEINADDMTIVQ